MILPILTVPNPVLKQSAQPINDFTDAGLHKLLADMIETIKAGPLSSGALAAPQVGSSKQVVVIVPPNTEPLVLINPEVLSTSGGKDKAWEHCFSIPGKRGRVKRYKEAEVRYFTPLGTEQLEKFTHFLARVVQHEIDHLQGILWTDLVESEEDVVSEEEYQRQRSEKPRN